MRKVKQGDLYYIQFDPSTGHEFQGFRPSVIISSDKIVKNASVVSCIPLTSNTQNYLEKCDIRVSPSEINKLRRESVIKGQYICTFDRNRIENYIGQLEEEHLDKLKQAIAQNFKL